MSSLIRCFDKKLKWVNLSGKKSVVPKIKHQTENIIWLPVCCDRQTSEKKLGWRRVGSGGTGNWHTFQWRTQDFPEGAPTPKVGVPPYWFANLLPKTSWIRGGGTSLVPPWIRQWLLLVMVVLTSPPWIRYWTSSPSWVTRKMKGKKDVWYWNIR